MKLSASPNFTSADGARANKDGFTGYFYPEKNEYGDSDSDTMSDRVRNTLDKGAKAENLKKKMQE